MTDGGITLAGLQHQIAFRLELERAVNGAHKHLHHVANVAQVGHRTEHILGEFCRDNLGEEVGKCLASLVGLSFGIAKARVVINIQPREDVHLVTSLQIDVLSLDGDIAVGGTDGDAREGIDGHRAERRIDFDGSLVALHVYLV